MNEQHSAGSTDPNAWTGKEPELSLTGYTPPPRIFSGDYSRDMWAKVNAITDPEALEAVYFICCRLQEFESFVRSKLP